MVSVKKKEKKRNVVTSSKNPLGMRTMTQLAFDLMLIFGKLQTEHHSPIKSVHIRSTRRKE